MSISLVVGLGNPGRDYENTRHNAGFLVVDALARQLGLAWQKQRPFEAEIARWDPAPGRVVYLAKPLTFMNESGRSVQALTGFYKIPPSAVIAVYDEITVNLGLVKVSVSGSAGGHNGVTSLLARLGNGFIRYRIGIGPKDPPQMDIADYVLGQFTSSQTQLFTQNLERYVAGLRLIIDQGAERAMNQLNRRDSQQ